MRCNDLLCIGRLVSKADKVMYTMHIFVGNNWRFYWDVSWMLNHRKTQNYQNCPNCQNYFKISKLGLIFSLWGWAGFWVWTGFLPALTQKRHQLHITIYTIINHCVNWPHLCVPIRVSRMRGWWIIISLPLVCHGSVYCASMPACQKSTSMPEDHP